MIRNTLNLTLEERSKFESLLAEYANAEMDCVRAIGRRHDAMHRVLDFVNDRTGQLATESYHEGIASVHVAAMDAAEPPSVPTGTTPGTAWKASAFTDAEIARGSKHYMKDAPVGVCACATCCEARALASIGKSAEGLPFSDPGNTPAEG